MLGEPRALPRVMLARLRRVLRLPTVLAGGHRALALENVALRQPLAMGQRARPRPAVRWADRRFWVGLRRVWPDWKAAVAVVRRPEGDVLERECSVPAREDREQSNEAKQAGEHDPG